MCRLILIFLGHLQLWQRIVSEDVQVLAKHAATGLALRLGPRLSTRVGAPSLVGSVFTLSAEERGHINVSSTVIDSRQRDVWAGQHRHRQSSPLVKHLYWYPIFDKGLSPFVKIELEGVGRHLPLRKKKTSCDLLLPPWGVPSADDCVSAPW